MKPRFVVSLILIGFILWFLYLERSILTPFVLAAIFGYLLNPLINILSQRTKLNRVYFVVLLYVLLFAFIGWGGTVLTRQIFQEVKDLDKEIALLLKNTDSQVAALPQWLQAPASDTLVSLRDTLKIEPSSIWPFFSGAASRVISTITFLFASFFFLKDGRKFIDQLLLLFSGEHKLEVEILFNKMNGILGNYLRGQLLIVVIMAVFGVSILSFYGVKFSLILGFMIGLAEIVPMLGPIIAGTTIFLIATFDGLSRFGLSPLYDGLAVVATYIIVNQLENYLIVPPIMGKFTKLHPLIILFAVLAGGHLFGILGFMLAVPVAASMRIIFEYLLDKLASS